MRWFRPAEHFGGCTEFPKETNTPHHAALGKLFCTIDHAEPLAYNSPMPLPPRKPGGQGWPSGMARPARARTEQKDQFRALNASLLYCPRCRVATPTRERLLLVLPTGNLYEYLCQQCGTSTGSKTEQERGGMLHP